jgi:hypothetical protein
MQQHNPLIASGALQTQKGLMHQVPSVPRLSQSQMKFGDQSMISQGSQKSLLSS